MGNSLIFCKQTRFFEKCQQILCPCSKASQRQPTVEKKKQTNKKLDIASPTDLFTSQTKIL